MRLWFFLGNSILLGAGLAMDAFSVCLANGLSETDIKGLRKYKMAGVFAFFQALMPLTGWICVRTIARIFVGFQRFIPIIAFLLLFALGVKMICESLRQKKGDTGDGEVIISGRRLILQGIATSIDALSTGFAISDYSFPGAGAAALIIGAVTFFICLAGLTIGRRIGEHLADKAMILGGVILICIGIEMLTNYNWRTL